MTSPPPPLCTKLYMLHYHHHHLNQQHPLQFTTSTGRFRSSHDDAGWGAVGGGGYNSTLYLEPPAQPQQLRNLGGGLRGGRGVEGC
jgi:hypothetical protein